jgi:methylenetetrahydrofolate reductase (NADPH)
MKVPEILEKAEKTLFSFELLPPLKGDSIETIYNTIDPLMEFKPAYINVTYHREEVVYKSRGEGLLEKKIVRKRPGTVGIAAGIKYKYKVEVVPHIICGGFNKQETENALIDLHFLGIHNILALRGDTKKDERVFMKEPDGHAYALELLRQIMEMNKGKYLDEELQNNSPTSFTVGVAGYPEKHVESPNMESDLHYLKKKVEAGAEYIVTQMFFDNSKYFRFVRQCREIGITVPIIPGLKLINSKKQLSSLPQMFNIDIPGSLVIEMKKCRSDTDLRQLGVEWTIAQAKELMDHGVPAIHFFTMGKSDNVRKVCESVF